MVRGDDVYLLDFCLDELNTVGAGARYALTADTSVALHAGVNQLQDDFQYQEQTVAGPGFATEHGVPRPGVPPSACSASSTSFSPWPGRTSA